MKDHSFDGNDPIRVLDFLARMVTEADMLDMSEAQAFVALPCFLKGTVRTQYDSNLTGGSGLGGVSCWPEAVQYLLRTYATHSARREALR